MSVNLNALKQYQSVDLRATVETASPHKMVSMLFDGALKALATAKGCCERTDIEGRSASINKASDIIVGLKGCLDLDQGGEVAQRLDELYDYSLRQLYQANKENSAELVQEIIGLISEVSSGWNDMPVEYKVGEK
jgi:flagellar protein FliS